MGPGGASRRLGDTRQPSLLPLAEAKRHGCDQAVFLDAKEHHYVEELGGMNLYFVFDDGQVVTPASDSSLEGIIRKSLHDIAADLGYAVTERYFGIDEWTQGVASGRITEVFACGTAAVITPVGRLLWSEGEVNSAATGEAGPVTTTLRRALVDLQYGRAKDTAAGCAASTTADGCPGSGLLGRTMMKHRHLPRWFTPCKPPAGHHR